MAVDRLSITVEAELGRAVREAAGASGMSVSSWIAEALAHSIRRQNMKAFLDDWQAEEGPFTEEERAWASDAFAEAEELRRAAATEKAADRLAS